MFPIIIINLHWQTNEKYELENYLECWFLYYLLL